MRGFSCVQANFVLVIEFQQQPALSSSMVQRGMVGERLGRRDRLLTMMVQPSRERWPVLTPNHAKPRVFEIALFRHSHYQLQGVLSFSP